MGIYQCWFVNNLAVQRGGAVFMNNIGSIATSDYSEPSWIYNCLFRGNNAGFSTDPAVTSGTGGGAIYLQNYDNQPSFANNLFHGNIARGWGSAMAVRPVYASGDLTFSNNTVSQNTGIVGPGGIPIGGTVPATTPGGALVFDGPSSQSGGGDFQVNNNIVWKNPNVGVSTEIVGTAVGLGRVNVRYSDVYDGVSTQVWPGPGNINAVPGFVNDIVGNFDLLVGPCVDVGSDAYLPEDLPVYGGLLQGGTLPVIDYDYEGNPLIRPRSFDVLTVTNSPGLTDMGCFELQNR
jgi:hypothetical protein